MSKRNHIAIFERRAEPTDNFGTASATWEEVAREWVGLTPQPVGTQRTEFVDAAQTKVTRKTVADCIWTPTLASVTTDCRMRVGERVFGIETILNVGERNHELQFMVTENG